MNVCLDGGLYPFQLKSFSTKGVPISAQAQTTSVCTLRLHPTLLWHVRLLFRS